LRARNALFKSSSVRKAEVEAFNQPLTEAGEELLQLRSQLIDNLSQFAPEASATISGAGENLQLSYIPGANPGTFSQELAQNFSEDIRLRSTTVGPHRDDITFLLDGVDARNFASEGQQRTIVLALKLAHCRHLQSAGETPLLLFDDIFGELDPARRNGLFGALPSDARCFITTTTLDWLRQPSGQVWQLDRL
jgi:DNA replication and repair protein RecF